MKTWMHRMAVAAVIAGAIPAAPAHAQLGDLLKQGQNAGSTGATGKLGGLGGLLSGGALSSGSTGNVAGLLEFCIKNNYLGAQGSSSIKDKLMGKLGGTPTPETGYADGAKGLLKSGDGKQLDLSGGGLKAQATRQICDRILAQAKSML
jgi:hypothetical protein